jgi:o-succinylbenzoate---CoA ligase
MDPLREAARRDPGGEAAAVPVAGGVPESVSAGLSWSWRELDERADAAALHLASTGVGPGSLVATLLPPSPQGLVLLHAVPRAGGILVPLHPAWTLSEVRRALTGVGGEGGVGGGAGTGHGSAPMLLVVPDDRVPDLRAAFPGVGVIPVEEVTEFAGATGGWRPSDVLLDADAPVALILTSGSTGAPRPVPVTRGNLLASARGAAERLRLDPADRWLASLALAHVGGLALLHRGAVVGSTTVFAGPFEPDRFLALADAGEITHASLVPVMLRRLLDVRGGRPAPRALRCVLLGGAGTPRPLLDEALDARWPVALTWGMTEASSQVATAPPDQVRRKPGTVGRPLFGVTVRVVGPDGRARPRGDVGELVVAGPTVTPLASVASSGGWHRTGDLGRFDTDGDLWITGRASDRIVSGGVTVEPAEVEAALLAHQDVAEVAVAGRPDPHWGERVVAFVVPARPAAPPSTAELDAFSRERLAASKRPRAWVFLDALPRNANGKVDRKALRAGGGGASG